MTTRGSPYDYENKESSVETEKEIRYLVYGFGGLMGDFDDYEAACKCYAEQKEFGIAKMAKKEITKITEIEELPRWYHNW